MIKELHGKTFLAKPAKVRVLEKKCWLIVKPHIYEEQCGLCLDHGEMGNHVILFKLLQH